MPHSRSRVATGRRGRESRSMALERRLGSRTRGPGQRLFSPRSRSAVQPGRMRGSEGLWMRVPLPEGGAIRRTSGIGSPGAGSGNSSGVKILVAEIASTRGGTDSSESAPIHSIALAPEALADAGASGMGSMKAKVTSAIKVATVAHDRTKERLMTPCPSSKRPATAAESRARPPARKTSQTCKVRGRAFNFRGYGLICLISGPGLSPRDQTSCSISGGGCTGVLWIAGARGWVGRLLRKPWGRARLEPEQGVRCGKGD